MANAIAIVAAARYIPRLRRAQNKIRIPMESTEDIRLSLRLTEDQLNVIAMEYHRWRANRAGHPIKWSPSMTGRKIFFHYLARGGYYHQIARCEGVAKCTVHGYIHDAATFFQDTANLHIRFPTHAELDGIGLNLQDPDDPQVLDRYKVVLYIDGFVVKIQRPDHAGDAYFCGRHGKSCDSINVQYVNDRYGQVRHVITGTIWCNT